MFLKYKKIILSAVLASFILSGFYFISVTKTYASDFGGSWANFWQYNVKEFVVDTIARGFARRLLKKYLDSVVTQVNKSGRTGRQPSFALNWRNFLTDGQYRGEDVFRAILSNTELCPYFKNPIRTAFNVTTNTPVTQNTRVNNLDPFTKRGRCTLPRGWTIEDYTADFARNGGWQALNQLAEPQNNFYGSFLMSLGEVSAQRALDASADRGEIQAGGGFTGTRASCKGSGASGLCLSKPLPPGVQGPEAKYCTNISNKQCESNADCVVNNSEARCKFLGETLTPGKLLGDSASQYIDKNIGWLITSDELSEVLLNMLGGIIGKMTNFRQKNDDGTAVDDTEGSRTDSKVSRCSRQCAGKKGNVYQACMNTCMGSGNETNLPAPCSATDPECSNPVPPPPSGGPVFCNNTDADGDGQLCDASIGENINTCPSDCTGVPAAQCQNATDTNGDSIADTGDDDGDGLVDAPGLGWINGPDPGCSSPFDNTELDTATTFQCNDGLDNDGDAGQPGGGIDYPADSSCTSATDNSEITLTVSLCGNLNSFPPCQGFSASCSNLANCLDPNPSNTVGNDNAESFTGTPLLFNTGFAVDLCLDPNYGRCTSITPTMLSSGVIDNLGSIFSIGLNDVSSIKVCQNGQDPITKACLP